MLKQNHKNKQYCPLINCFLMFDIVYLYAKKMTMPRYFVHDVVASEFEVWNENTLT